MPSAGQWAISGQPLRMRALISSGSAAKRASVCNSTVLSSCVISVLASFSSNSCWAAASTLAVDRLRWSGSNTMGSFAWSSRNFSCRYDNTTVCAAHTQRYFYGGLGLLGSWKEGKRKKNIRCLARDMSIIAVEIYQSGKNLLRLE